MSTKDIGDVLEDQIRDDLSAFLPEDSKVEIRKTKGSGAVRGDGDVRIQLKDEYHTVLLILDGKATDSNPRVPSRKEIEKVESQGKNHAALGGIIVSGSSKNGAVFAGTSWKTMQALLLAYIDNQNAKG